jgi:hypothetical protein
MLLLKTFLNLIKFTLILKKSIWIFLAIVVVGQDSLGKDCTSLIQQYVVRGDLKGTSIGARLWRLADLKIDSVANKQCSRELLPRAISETDQYWNFIDKKYSCGISKDTPKIIKNCSAQLEAEVRTHYRYLELLKFEALNSKGTCISGGFGKRHMPFTGKQQFNLQQIVSGFNPAIKFEDQCSNIPENERFDFSSDNTSGVDFINDLAHGEGSCLKARITVFLSRRADSSMAGLAAGNVTLKSRKAVITALQAIQSEIAKNEEQTLNKMFESSADSLFQTLLVSYKKFDCYNSEKKVEILCSMIQKNPNAVLELILGSKIFIGNSPIEAAIAQWNKKESLLSRASQEALLRQSGAAPIFTNRILYNKSKILKPEKGNSAGRSFQVQLVQRKKILKK